MEEKIQSGALVMKVNNMHEFVEKKKRNNAAFVG